MSDTKAASRALPAFLVVAGILLLAAVGLNGATQFLQLHFRKLPVPLAMPLEKVPSRLGPWVQVSIDEPISHDIQETLATDKYIFRDYVDSRKLSPQVLDEFKEKTPNERRRLLASIQTDHADAVMRLSATYYTGSVDTVAHVPDRCFVADGYEPSHYDIERWTALKDLPGDKSTRYIVFEDSTPGRGKVPVNVAYFFNCNGQYTSDSIAVRMKLAELTSQYGYYMKIELMTVDVPAQKSAEIMNDFLGFAVPELSKCLPDWNALLAEAKRG